jgi:phosphopantothenoylcysteine decarboxylase/phosphopantothenate--cysteine ligase
LSDAEKVQGGASTGPLRPLVGRRITLCVTGSVAAYKSALLARSLLRAGAHVEALMTSAALQFLGRETLAGLTGRPVHTELFHGAGELHVELAARSDLIAIVPATADALARLAQGRADDLLAATVLCARCPVLIAPAMHPNMWSHPLVQANVERLRRVANWQLLGPVHGEVASGEIGVGRMLEPEPIASAIEAALHGSAPPVAATRAALLFGRHVVVTAGPTLEDLDPARFISNRSSGKMGFAIAASAAQHGARVTLIAGPVALATPHGVDRIDVRSALDLQAALKQVLGEKLLGADALVMCAAVADYRPRARATTKLKRSERELALDLIPNPDLLAEVGAARTGSRPLLVGFALETHTGEQLLEAARRKLAAKRIDAIVANTAADAIGTDATRALLVTPTAVQQLGPAEKSLVADQLTEFLVERLASAQGT